MKHEELDKLLTTEFKSHVVQPSADFTSALMDIVEPVSEVRTVEADAASFAWIWPVVVVALVVACSVAAGSHSIAPKVDWQRFSGQLATPIGTLTVFALFLVCVFFVLEERLMHRPR